MTQQVNLFGEIYNDLEPCFAPQADGNWLFDLSRNRWLKTQPVLDKAETDSHDWSNREIGIPSINWQQDHTFYNGIRFAPGLDTTSGLGTEAITNGETWTGATGSTPPTGWTAEGLSPTYSLNAGVLTAAAAGAGNHGISQDVTVTPGTQYIIEVGIVSGSDRAWISANGVTLPLPNGGGVFAASLNPKASPLAIDLLYPSTGTLKIDYIRVYEEAELTGAGPATAGGGGGNPPPSKDVVLGPYSSGDTTFFIQYCPDSPADPVVWFEIGDGDSDPDIKLSLMQVCESDVSDSVKLSIHTKLLSIGSGLPCITARGTVRQAYSKGETA